ncbi:MAG: hypothetical protein ACO3AW_03485 [Chitinophagaceae bacterium]
MNEVMINEMLRYFYHELSSVESISYEHFLNDNPYLMEIYQSYTQTLGKLSISNYSPSQATIDNILHYANVGELPNI